ncbi:MAG: hypothetical protein ACJ75S_06825 [Solirubrobacterales bacterium]|jgi:hypothetical protein
MTTHSELVRSTSGPVNRDAARVMMPGVHYEKTLHPDAKHWKVPPPHYRFIPQAGNPQSIDLTGTKFGLLTVVGWMGAIGGSCGRQRKGPDKPPKRMGAWLVRCACGDYEVRTARAIRNPNNKSDRCSICRDVQYKREHTPEAVRRDMNKKARGK